MTVVTLQETLLSSDTSFTVRAVIQLYMNILLRQTETGRHEAELQYSDVLTTTRSDTQTLEGQYLTLFKSAKLEAFQLRSCK